jgi:hypothetical protein
MRLSDDPSQIALQGEGLGVPLEPCPRCQQTATLAMGTPQLTWLACQTPGCGHTGPMMGSPNAARLAWNRESRWQRQRQGVGGDDPHMSRPPPLPDLGVASLSQVIAREDHAPPHPDTLYGQYLCEGCGDAMTDDVLCVLCQTSHERG